MKSGMLHFFESPGARSEHQAIAENVSLLKKADEHGFDSLRSALR